MAFVKISEQSSLYNDLEKKPVREILEEINTEDHKVADAVQKAIPNIEKLVEGIVERMKKGGRIFYIGAGTSGRLGVLDASEIPPTFGMDPSWVIGVIAGGDTALRNAVENAEDDTEQGWKDLEKFNINSKDTLIGIAASGTTPYVIGAVREARRHGYPVGAYHFFSTRPAARQAAFFLKKARLRRGDLPPMLDMELDDRKIAAMGGRDALFRGMLVWLEAVERHCGTTPIIYVNQNFVNRHMPFAPERLKDYPVWVARYGEYKPYVHLLYWQLSPDGTVEGIRSRVDINVFNGSEESFKDYLRRECVK